MFSEVEMVYFSHTLYIEINCEQEVREAKLKTSVGFILLLSLSFFVLAG